MIREYHPRGFQVCPVKAGDFSAGALKPGDQESWASRNVADKEVMLANAIKGKNTMSPKCSCMEHADGNHVILARHSLYVSLVQQRRG